MLKNANSSQFNWKFYDLNTWIMDTLLAFLEFSWYLNILGMLHVLSTFKNIQTCSKGNNLWYLLLLSCFSLQPNEYLEVAEKAASFIRRNLYDLSTQRLQHSFRNGPSKAPGFLDDYAFLINGLLDLYEFGGKIDWLSWAIELQATQASKLSLAWYCLWLHYWCKLTQGTFDRISSFWTEKGEAIIILQGKTLLSYCA